jgi:hypothetical protein
MAKTEPVVKEGDNPKFASRDPMLSGQIIDVGMGLESEIDGYGYKMSGQGIGAVK